MRLAKFLAHAGVASRRRAEQLILSGRVAVNGETVSRLSFRVGPSDRVELDGRAVPAGERKRYLLLDKPRGVLSTVRDPRGRPTVMDLLPGVAERVYPVGRLDADTEGVLLLTNDGELAYRLTHPRFGIEKVYRAWVQGIPTAEALKKISRGVVVEGKATAPARVKLLKTEGGRKALLEITLTEGRKRQVRLMCAAAGHPVLRLRRVRFAFLTARGLKSGLYRDLAPAEVRRLYKLVKLEPPHPVRP